MSMKIFFMKGLYRTELKLLICYLDHFLFERVGDFVAIFVSVYCAGGQ